MKLLNYRNVSTEVHELSENRILLTGVLVDRLAHDRAGITSFDAVPANRPRHEMRAELEIDTGTLTITAARATMVTYPEGDCIHVESGISALVGVRVTQGFFPEVQRLMGGPRGCEHLRCLIFSMAPTLMQALEVIVSKHIEEWPFDTLVGQLRDSCYNFRSGAAAIAKLEREMAELGAPANVIALSKRD